MTPVERLKRLLVIRYDNLNFEGLNKNHLRTSSYEKYVTQLFGCQPLTAGLAFAQGSIAPVLPRSTLSHQELVLPADAQLHLPARQTLVIWGFQRNKMAAEKFFRSVTETIWCLHWNCQL